MRRILGVHHHGSANSYHYEKGNHLKHHLDTIVQGINIENEKKAFSTSSKNGISLNTHIQTNKQIYISLFFFFFFPPRKKAYQEAEMVGNIWHILSLLEIHISTFNFPA